MFVCALSWIRNTLASFITLLYRNVLRKVTQVSAVFCKKDYEYLRMTGARAHESDASPLSGTGIVAECPAINKETVMISRRGSIIRAMVVFGSLGIAALVWSYSIMEEQRGGGSVEVQQIKEPAWGVEVKELSADASSTTRRSR